MIKADYRQDSLQPVSKPVASRKILRQHNLACLSRCLKACAGDNEFGKILLKRRLADSGLRLMLGWAREFLIQRASLPDQFRWVMHVCSTILPLRRPDNGKLRSKESGNSVVQILGSISTPQETEWNLALAICMASDFYSGFFGNSSGWWCPRTGGLLPSESLTEVSFWKGFSWSFHDVDSAWRFGTCASDANFFDLKGNIAVQKAIIPLTLLPYCFILRLEKSHKKPRRKLSA